jgi:hypothetical protein
MMPLSPSTSSGLVQAEFHDAGRDLGDLRWRMRARIARVRQQRIDRAIFDLQV